MSLSDYKIQPPTQSHTSQLQNKLISVKNVKVEHINNSGLLEVSFDYRTDDILEGAYFMFLMGDFATLPYQGFLPEQGATSYNRMSTIWDATKVLKTHKEDEFKTYSVGLKISTPSGSQYEQAPLFQVDIRWSPNWSFKDDNTPLDYINFNKIDEYPSEIKFEFKPFNGNYKYHFSSKLEYYSSGTLVGANMPFTDAINTYFYDAHNNLLDSSSSSSEMFEVDEGYIGDSDLIIGTTNARCLTPKWVGIKIPEPLAGDWEDYIDRDTEIKITCKSNTEAI